MPLRKSHLQMLCTQLTLGMIGSNQIFLFFVCPPFILYTLLRVGATVGCWTCD